MLLLFYILALCAGLWGVAQPELFLLLCVSAPVLYAVGTFLPLPNWLRRLLQFILLAAVFGWGRFRLHAIIPFDIGFLECSAILLQAFFLERKERRSALCPFALFLLLGYGALYSDRIFFGLSFFLALFAFFGYLARYRRQAYLGRAFVGATVALPTQKRHFRIKQFFLVSGVVLLIFLSSGSFLCLFPVRRVMPTRGFAPVGFRTRQELLFPQVWKKWAISRFFLEDPLASTDSDSVEGNPSTLSDTATSLIAGNGPMDSRAEGNGSSMGRALLFRVYSPAKLYWMVQAYDVYDGNEWKRSNTMKRGNNQLDHYLPSGTHEVVQHYLLMQPRPGFLPAAHRAEQVYLRYGMQYYRRGIRIVRRDAVSYELTTNTKLPETLGYRAVSTLPPPKQPAEATFVLRQKGTYRQIPKGVISHRVKQLAQSLVKDAQTPMEKAAALQNYLRNNYTYDLNVPRIPADKEPVDYFLFNSRRGVCRHYAQAYVILCRLSGLPARLCVGYSPGKYNVISNCFEVYEYHAHAWAQVFVAPWGWLTFDPTPPQNIDLAEDKGLLNHLLDPFGENWTARPPELSYHPPVRKQEMSVSTGDESDPSATLEEEQKATFFDRIYQYATQIANSGRPDPVDVTLAVIRATVESLWNLAKWCTACLATAWRSGKQFVLSVVRFIRRNPWLSGGLFSLLLLCCIFRKRICSRAGRWLEFFRCHRARRALEALPDGSAQIPFRAYSLLARMLALYGMNRPPLADLLEAVEYLPPALQPYREEYLQVAKAAALNAYAGGKKVSSPGKIRKKALCLLDILEKKNGI